MSSPESNSTRENITETSLNGHRHQSFVPEGAYRSLPEPAGKFTPIVELETEHQEIPQRNPIGKKETLNFPPAHTGQESQKLLDSRVDSPHANLTAVDKRQNNNNLNIHNPPGRSSPQIRHQTIVKISIGRVEVKAISEPQVKQKRNSSPVPTMSLDNYLKSRGEDRG